MLCTGTVTARVPGAATLLLDGDLGVALGAGVVLAAAGEVVQVGADAADEAPGVAVLRRQLVARLAALGGLVGAGVLDVHLRARDVDGDVADGVVEGGRVADAPRGFRLAGARRRRRGGARLRGRGRWGIATNRESIREFGLLR